MLVQPPCPKTTRWRICTWSLRASGRSTRSPTSSGAGDLALTTLEWATPFGSPGRMLSWAGPPWRRKAVTEDLPYPTTAVLSALPSTGPAIRSTAGRTPHAAGSVAGVLEIVALANDVLMTSPQRCDRLPPWERIAAITAAVLPARILLTGDCEPALFPWRVRGEALPTRPGPWEREVGRYLLLTLCQSRRLRAAGFLMGHPRRPIAAKADFGSVVVNRQVTAVPPAASNGADVWPGILTRRAGRTKDLCS